ncbi:Glutamate-rich protein 6 Protein FAM194A [Larimichthys crocea]|uniref:Glutamate-rich protein 6 Protein FAM194A n=1 Tax=Larimichthys crocea TaxID=215358 RepID=A0A6G0J6P8_LARCR|nr:Glutamate-rich protein 6 Protein FAM194A [Larimichthys crocea]
MSESPPYERDAASASPESPKEKDFSSQLLLCDNPNSLEEHEAHEEDQKDPIVIMQDNCSGSPSNAHVSGPVSPEFMEVRGLDGRFITLVSSQTQTDWEWVEQSLSFSCQVQKEIEDLQLSQAAVESVDTDSSQVQSHGTTALLFSDIELGEESEDESMPEKGDDIARVGPPRLIAYKPEPRKTRVGKVPEVESKQDVHLVQCDYCQQLCQPFVHSERSENETDFERLFCCEQAKQMTTAHPGRERQNGAERVRLRRLKKRKPKPKQAEQVNANIDIGRIEIKHKTFRLPKEVPNDEPDMHQINIKTTTGMFTLQEETDGEPKECLKLKGIMKKFYKSGKCFCTSYPDGAGNVFYPSGNAAIIISSAEAADFTYIILEDKDVAPNIKGIFTNKGHSTCYHPNGMIWLNLTPAGGLCLSETGALRRRWNWLYFDPHVRNLPFKPLTFALGPNISVRIHSQEHMYITFAHRQNSVRFSVGSKLKLMYPERHDKPGQDVLERYIQTKSSEIYSLLGQMQTCMSLHYSFITQTQQLSRQMEKEKSPKEIKTDVN